MWKKIKHLALAPWKWLWVNIKDWRTAIIFLIVFVVVSSEIWVPYIIGGIAFACGNNVLGSSMVSFASVCWLFWLGPGTPFLGVCIGITAGVKALFNKIITLRKKKQEVDEDAR